MEMRVAKISAAVIAYQMPSTPRSRGRRMTEDVWNTSVRKNEMAAEISPLPSAVKNEGGENVESRKQKRIGKQPERMARQREQSLVVPDEDLRQRRGQYPREYRQHDAGGAHQDDAHAQHVFEFRVVLRAVVEADDRRAADGIADIDGNEDKLDVHQNAIGRYAVLAEVFEQLEVIDHADDGGRDIAHQLG